MATQLAHKSHKRRKRHHDPNAAKACQEVKSKFVRELAAVERPHTDSKTHVRFLGYLRNVPSPSCFLSLAPRDGQYCMSPIPFRRSCGP